MLKCNASENRSKDLSTFIYVVFLMEWFTGLINTSMASARMTRYCFERKYLGDSYVKSYTYMMNT